MSSSKSNSGEFDIRPFSFNRVLSKGRDDESNKLYLEESKKKAEEAGYKAGFESGLQQAGEILHRLENLTHSLEQSREERYARLEEEILDLIFRIAEKVIHSEIRNNPSARTAIIAAGLKKFKEHEKIKIRISPTDLAAVQEALPALCAMNGITGEVTLQEDVALSDGSCILETDQCEVDARIEKGLQAIGEALKGL